MTGAADLATAIESLRAAVARSAAGTLRHVTVELTEPHDVSDLEEILGAAHELPRATSPSSARRVQFDDTVPDEGEVGATVLAELDGGGRVSSLLIRRDEY
ncbi:MAG TPA: hypothetical protein VM345_16160 [Acidimicrobiales bacterium]|jgi:hypothetical protein|nr:hypothetical protein [Acidimicrobiales bacterium]